MKSFKETINTKVNKNDLVKEYNDAKKNPLFLKKIKELNKTDEELMKYTQSIMECITEQENCENCKSLLGCKNIMQGYYYDVFNESDELVFKYVKCNYLKEYEEKTNYQKNVYHINVPKDLKSASFKDLYREDVRLDAIKFIMDFYKNYNKDLKGMYLQGSFGSGKTYIISALFNELSKQNIKSMIMYFPEFLSDLKGSFSTNFNEKLDRAKKIELLLIDDIGAESVTEWGRDEILGSILQARTQANLPTFFTSNLDINGLEAHLTTSKDKVSIVKAKRIIERIKFLTEEISLIGNNYRNKK